MASLAWGIVRVDPALDRGQLGAGTISFLFSKPAVLVSSARYLHNLHFKTEAFTSSADDAAHLASGVTAFFSIFHAAENSAASSSSDPDVKAFLDSLKVEQHGDRCVLDATIPPGFLHKALAEPPGERSGTSSDRQDAQSTR